MHTHIQRTEKYNERKVKARTCLARGSRNCSRLLQTARSSSYGSIFACSASLSAHTDTPHISKQQTNNRKKQKTKEERTQIN